MASCLGKDGKVTLEAVGAETQKDKGRMAQRILP